MAATLALIAALSVALAATLEQKGTLTLPRIICLAREAADPVPAPKPEAGLPAAPIPARDT